MNGIDKSFIYFGALFSSFGLHREDMDMFSANIHHSGSPYVS
jgi:hypothetical protein